MFNVEEILKMSREMGIKISDGMDDRHYILDNRRERVEFSTTMLMKIDEESTSYKMKWKVSTNYNNSEFNSNYRLADSKNSYVSESVNVNQSIINAA